VTHPAATRFLAARYASIAADAQRRADAGLTIDALQELGLLDAPDAECWLARLERLGEDPAERALLPAPYRDRARALLAEGGGDEVRRALEAVGALTWHDAAPETHAPLGLVVERVIVAPAQRRSDLTIASLALFDDMLHVHWYAAEPGTGVGRPRLSEGGGPFGLQPSDDLRTRYHGCGGGSSSARGCSSPGHSAFRPAPPATAAWIDLSAGDEHLVRVPLG